MQQLRFIISVLLLLMVLPLCAQDEGSEFTRQLWLDFMPKYNLSEKEALTGDISYRTVWPRDWQRFVIRGAYQYSSYELIFKGSRTRESLIGGIGLFYLSDFQTYNSLEIRPFQGYEIDLELAENISFSQLLRIEERINLVFDDSETSNFGLRFRYRILADLHLRGISFFDGVGFYFPVSIEFFFNAISIKQFNDVIRLTPGMGYQFNSDFKILFTTAYHYTKQEIGSLIRTNDIVFRFSVIKTFF